MNLEEKLTIEEKKMADMYSHLVFSVNFEKLLARAIFNDTCLLCSENQILKNGLCLSCSVRIQSPLTQYVLKEYEVVVSVKRIGEKK